MQKPTQASLPSPFTKILVANRGEIALRILRTAKSLGLRTVAVYSDVDRDSPHVLAADETQPIGAAEPSASYLNIKAIIGAALRSGAQAVHPGYGFLSENPEFAQACAKAGLQFIGPSAQAISTMGNKAQAKRSMRAAGVPCIEGFETTHASEQSVDFLLSKAIALGFPVMIKACAGGGGRGMRVVDTKAQFEAALLSAKSEAGHAFKDSSVLLEKLIKNARHIEIQIVVDRYGNAIQLGERDCSIQRRHQKIIEEAPSPALNPRLRAAMGNIAVKAATAIGYEGVGTFEFLLDESGNFYFMEMNTRLQVEHPVTEAITGIDLVALQISIAQGLALEITQTDIAITGHAIELRLCAEDASGLQSDFTPQSGTVNYWHCPPDVRVDHALRSGIEVSPFYDSMMAKIIGYGKTREQAIIQITNALKELSALGIATNQAFLAACLTHTDFALGRATTGFVNEHHAELIQLANTTKLQNVHLIAAATLTQILPMQEKASAANALAHTFAIHLLLQANTIKGTNDAAPVVVQKLKRESGNFVSNGSESTLAFNVNIGNDPSGKIHRVELLSIVAHRAELLIDGEVFSIFYDCRGSQFWIQIGSITHQFTNRSYEAAISATQTTESDCKALTAGRVTAIFVHPGDVVVKGQALITLEAMKMERIHTAPRSGVISKIGPALYEQVKLGATLVSLV
jgi:geranyl-CoA carboxylase alpha subunit